MTCRCRRRIFLGLAVVALMLSAGAAWAANYRFTTIDYPGAAPPSPAGTTTVHAVNAAGQMVGEYLDASNKTHGFLWSKGVYTSIDYPGSTYTIANSINDSGQIVGTYVNGSGPILTNHGFLWSGGVYTSLDYPGAELTEANGISADGAVVGDYVDPTKKLYHAFLLVGGTGGTWTNVDVNDPSLTFQKGEKIIRETRFSVTTKDTNGIIHLYIKVDGETIKIAVSNGTETTEEDLNYGEVVGWYRDASNNVHGFHFQIQSGIYITLDYPGAVATQAMGINNAAQIVGGYFDAQKGLEHGFLKSGGLYTTVDYPGAYTTEADLINAAGQIVGFYFDPVNFNKHNFIAIPDRVTPMLLPLLLAD
jgi:probable HAF family extracellular repeat protein